MGITAVVVGAATAAVGYSQQRSAQRGAERSAKRAQASQQQANREQRAQQAAEAARERRTQVRQERVRRSQIMQASQGSGVIGSSGMIGAAGGLGAQLGSNLGFSTASVQRGQRVGSLMDQASGFQQQAANRTAQAQTWGQVYGLGASIFQQGTNSLFSSQSVTPSAAPVESRNI